jgi:hypothetical protein
MLWRICEELLDEFGPRTLLGGRSRRQELPRKRSGLNQEQLNMGYTVLRSHGPSLTYLHLVLQIRATGGSDVRARTISTASPASCAQRCLPTCL